jgi:hypothetical protein
MSTVQTWSYLMGVPPQRLTKNEFLLLEAELFIRVVQEIKKIFREKHKVFFNLMKYTIEMENTMIESNFVRLIIQDILCSEEYDLKGIAYYTNIPEEVVQEILMGLNTNPSAAILQRLIELHRLVRRDLYQTIFKKITVDTLAAA